MAKRNSRKKTVNKMGVPHATEASKTAQFANPRNSPPTKRERKLSARIKDFLTGSQAAKQDKQGTRWSAGGYHKPGSLAH